MKIQLANDRYDFIDAGGMTAKRLR